MKQFDPRLVAEAMIFLSSQNNTATGEMFTAAGNGIVARNDMYGSSGFRHPELTAELVGEHISEIRDMTKARPLWGKEGAAWQTALR
ncbi:hypothetical protein ACNPNP_10815 [Microbacterium sp. AGC85]